MLRQASKSKTLRVQCSDDHRRVKPSGFGAPTAVEGQKPGGFSAPTSVEGQNPRGSVLRRASKGKTLRVQCSDDRRRAKPWRVQYSDDRRRAESSGVQACYRGFRRKRTRVRFLSRRWKANSRRSAPCTCKLRSISVGGMSFGLSVSSSTAAARSSFSFGQPSSMNGFAPPAK